MSLFTPVTGMIGGSLIGGSAGVLLLYNGDIMGMSGILGNSLGKPVESLQNPKYHWRWVFLASFSMVVNAIVNYATPEVALKDDRAVYDNDVPIPSIIGHMLGGFLVGVGTKIANGCTTGHGICGIGRFSPRSLVAVCTFTGTSMLTKYLVSPLRSWSSMTSFIRQDTAPYVSPLAGELFTSSLALAAMIRPVAGSTSVDSAKTVGAALSGAIFAAGLAISGMPKNSKVHDFLCLSNLANGTYDPTLIAVMFSGIVSSWLSYQFVKGYGMFAKDKLLSCPIGLPKENTFSIPTNRTIDNRLITGSVIFGCGWGLTSICPAPAVYAAAAGVVDAIVAWLPSFLLGTFVGGKIVEEVWEKKEKKA